MQIIHYFCCLFVSIAEMKIQRRKKALVWIQLDVGVFPFQKMSTTLCCVRVVFLSLEMSMHVVLVRKALVGMTQLLKTKVLSCCAGGP